MKNEFIPMLDLSREHAVIRDEIDEAIAEVIDSSAFIKGEAVTYFEAKLAEYLSIDHVIGCANGTDALQLALMSLDLNEGDEIIIPAFTYIATVEVISLLKLTPVFADVDLHSFNCTASQIKKVISSKTKAVIPVHLFGQTCPMEEILTLASEHQFAVIEDNAQSLSAQKPAIEKSTNSAITHIGTSSFFPSKNLGCLGDGGAVYTNNGNLASKLSMLANHGQSKKYDHQLVGCNSRLDSIQAAVLTIKLQHVDSNNEKRNRVAEFYNAELSKMENVHIPHRSNHSAHIYHQYTIRVPAEDRDALQTWLKDNNIASAIYYLKPVYKQEAYIPYNLGNIQLQNTEELSKTVLSIPINPTITKEEQVRVVQTIRSYFKN